MARLRKQGGNDDEASSYDGGGGGARFRGHGAGAVRARPQGGVRLPYGERVHEQRAVERAVRRHAVRGRGALQVHPEPLGRPVLPVRPGLREVGVLRRGSDLLRLEHAARRRGRLRLHARGRLQSLGEPRHRLGVAVHHRFLDEHERRHPERLGVLQRPGRRGLPALAALRPRPVRRLVRRQLHDDLGQRDLGVGPVRRPRGPRLVPGRREGHLQPLAVRRAGPRAATAGRGPGRT